MEALRRIYGYRMFPGRGPYARAFRDWLLAEAEQARSNDDLARRFIARCRETMTILPAITTIERLCRSEEHTSELQSLMRITYAVLCLKTKKQTTKERIPITS